MKLVVGLYPEERHKAQSKTVRWYPIQLDGRSIYITRDSGVIEYVAFPGEGGFRCSGSNEYARCSGCNECVNLLFYPWNRFVLTNRK